jgi:hypothetical protein
MNLNKETPEIPIRLVLDKFRFSCDAVAGVASCHEEE